MKVRDLMTANPVACSPGDNLATVAMQMWDWDCGVLPVVDDGQIRGVITDRDICMALLFKGAPPPVTVAEVVNGHLYSCSPDDELAAALEHHAAPPGPPPARGRGRPSRGPAVAQ